MLAATIIGHTGDITWSPTPTLLNSLLQHEQAREDSQLIELNIRSLPDPHVTLHPATHCRRAHQHARETIITATGLDTAGSVRVLPQKRQGEPDRA